MAFRFHIAAAREISQESFRSFLKDRSWSDPQESNGWIWSTRRRMIDPGLFDRKLQQLPCPVLHASILGEDFWSLHLAVRGENLLNVTIPIDAFHAKHYIRWLLKIEKKYTNDITKFVQEMFGLDPELFKDIQIKQLSSALPLILDQVYKCIECALAQISAPSDHSALISILSSRSLESSEWNESIEHLAAFLVAVGLTDVFESPDEGVSQERSVFDPEMDVEAEIKEILDQERWDPFQIKCRNEFAASLSACMIGEYNVISDQFTYRQFDPDRFKTVLLSGNFESFVSVLTNCEFSLLGCLSCRQLQDVGFWGYTDRAREMCCLLIATGFNATVDIVTRFQNGSHIRSAKTDQEEIEDIKRFSRDVKKEALDLIQIHKDRIQESIGSGLTPIPFNSIEDLADSLHVVLKIRNYKIEVFDRLLSGNF